MVNDMNTAHSQSPNAGFTLLELLTAAAIASLLIVMLLSVFGQASKAWTSGEDQVELYQSGRAVLDLMARDLSQTRVQMPNYPFNGAATGVTFYAAVSDPPVLSDLDRVQYSWSAANGTLTRTNTPLGGTPSGASLITSNLVSFRLRYWANNASHTLTNSLTYNTTTANSNAPAAVEVTLGLLSSRAAAAYWPASASARMNITSANLRVFTEMIYLPNSQP